MDKYSILTYNIGGYEVLHEVLCPSPNAEYVYITDDRSITSTTWNVVYVDNPHPEDNFDLCWNIRFHPFDWVHTDTVMKIDGSMLIIWDTDPLIQAFRDGGYDIGLTPHPTRQTMLEEYQAWVGMRGYSVEQANRILTFFSVMGWNPQTEKGLYQYNFMIQRNDLINKKINDETFFLLKQLREEGKQIERVDQTVGSLVINRNEVKPMMLKQSDIFNDPFVWCVHGTEQAMQIGDNITPAYYKGEEVPWAVVPRS